MHMTTHTNVWDEEHNSTFIKVLTMAGWHQRASYFCIKKKKKTCSHVTWTNRKSDFDLSALCMLWEKVGGRVCLSSLSGVGAMSWSLSLILRGHTGRAGAPRGTATLGALRRSLKKVGFCPNRMFVEVQIVNIPTGVCAGIAGGGWEAEWDYT